MTFFCVCASVSVCTFGHSKAKRWLSGCFYYLNIRLEVLSKPVVHQALQNLPWSAWSCLFFWWCSRSNWSPHCCLAYTLAHWSHLLIPHGFFSRGWNLFDIPNLKRQKQFSSWKCMDKWSSKLEMTESSFLHGQVKSHGGLCQMCLQVLVHQDFHI